MRCKRIDAPDDDQIGSLAHFAKRAGNFTDGLQGIVTARHSDDAAQKLPNFHGRSLGFARCSA